MLATLCLAATFSAACTTGSGGGDKAGGAGEPVVLRLAEGAADSSTGLAVEEFVRRVGELSGGDLRIQLLPGWGNGSGAEQQTVADVAAGKADLGSVGTRVFDTLGVDSFRALSAPMLIDSYALEEAVIASPIPDQMLAGLDKLKLVGLAVLADGLRKPIAVQRPLLGPADWQGVTFAAFRSNGLAEAVQALGARPSDLIGEPLTLALRDGQVQGAENNLLVYQSNHRGAIAPYVTANVNLWPKTVALMANPGRFTKLTAQQQGWLRRAARETAAASTGLFAREDELVASVCAAGGRLANASQADLAGLQQAFAPVYVSLEQDAQTKAFIEAIQQLKRTTPAGPALTIPTGCTGQAASAVTTSDPIAGSWTTGHISESQWVHAFIALGGSEKNAHETFGATHYKVTTLTFQDGLFKSYCGGDGRVPELCDNESYEIGDDDTFALGYGGVTETYRYDLSGDILRLHFVNGECGAGCDYGALDPHGPVGPTLYAGFPLTRSN